MEDMDRYVGELSGAVWKQTLGLPLEPLAALPDNRGAATVESHVRITGLWTGTLVLQCSRLAARRAADVMFGPAAVPGSLQDLQDAVGEIANMIGGNLKALVSDGGCYLSLPSVIEARDYAVRIPGTRVVCRQAFVSEDEPIVVTLLEPRAA